MTKNIYETPYLTPMSIEVGGIICESVVGMEDYSITDYDWTEGN